MTTLIKNKENKDKIFNLNLVSSIRRFSYVFLGEDAHCIHFTFSVITEKQMEPDNAMWTFETEEGRNKTFDAIANVFDAVGL